MNGVASWTEQSGARSGSIHSGVRGRGSGKKMTCDAHCQNSLLLLPSRKERMRSVFQVRCHISVERPILELVFFETASTAFNMFIEDWPWEETFALADADGADEERNDPCKYSRDFCALEHLMQTQRTHDIICPVCDSCITEVVILRKRKRSPAPAADEGMFQHVKLRKADTTDLNVDLVIKGRAYPGYQTEDRGCLVGLWSFLFRKSD
ncbi:hypothetical protein AXG93_3789s1050 [Marchantia polymorpha subsp. ruderalis]|uniref:Uncharacterized protein n=1 Tax=Marchantia polymorpha subsp. ruderalis TaxID=1480154 RepID=A0A176WGE1_MARPO|nr:hypothetical protein AXG93_3789s1050 [Marchantia polymorpha subsp. ruderalis]